MVFDKVKSILVEQLEVDEDAVTMDASILDDLDADSLALVDMVMALEDEFELEIDEDKYDSFKTVGDIVRYIEENA